VLSLFSGASSKRKQITSAIAPLVDLARSHDHHLAAVWLQFLAYGGWRAVDFWLVRHDTSPFRKIKNVGDRGVQRFAAVVVADLLIRFLASEQNRGFMKDVEGAVGSYLPESVLLAIDPLGRSYFERFTAQAAEGDTVQTSFQFYLALTTTDPNMYRDMMGVVAAGNDLGPMHDLQTAMQVPVFQSAQYKSFVGGLQIVLGADPDPGQLLGFDLFRGYEPKRI
jgi:hypothetical protein